MWRYGHGPGLFIQFTEAAACESARISSAVLSGR